MTLKRVFWSVFALAMLNYAVMVFWSLPIIQNEAGGLRPLDLRPVGYSFAEAQAFLQALTAEGKAQYQGAQRILDICFPLLEGLTFSLAFFLLYSRLWACVFSVLALLVTLGDWRENHLVGRMLALGADGIDSTLVAMSSQMTMFKSFMVMLCILILLIKGLKPLLGKWKS